MRTNTTRELAAIHGQPALFAGAGVTVQVPLFNLAPAPAPDAPPCTHEGDRQVQLSLDETFRRALLRVRERGRVYVAAPGAVSTHRRAAAARVIGRAVRSARSVRSDTRSR